MRTRRLFALLTSITMLHLTVASADPACATHAVSHHQGAGMANAMPMHAHAMPSTPPCESPAQQNCCEALVGCSVAGAIASARQLLAVTVLPATRVCEGQHDAPASFASAPEPPPPKA